MFINQPVCPEQLFTDCLLLIILLNPLRLTLEILGSYFLNGEGVGNS